MSFGPHFESITRLSPAYDPRQDNPRCLERWRRTIVTHTSVLKPSQLDVHRMAYELCERLQTLLDACHCTHEVSLLHSRALHCGENKRSFLLHIRREVHQDVVQYYHTEAVKKSGQNYEARLTIRALMHNGTTVVRSVGPSAELERRESSSLCDTVDATGFAQFRTNAAARDVAYDRIHFQLEVIKNNQHTPAPRGTELYWDRRVQTL